MLQKARDFFQFPLLTVLSGGLALEPSIRIIQWVSKCMRSLCLNAEKGGRSTFQEILCLNPAGLFRFKEEMGLLPLHNAEQSALLGEGEHDIHHSWGTTFSSPGANASLAAGGRLSAMLFRRLVPGILLPLAGLLTFFVVNKIEQAQLLMSDNDICHARSWPVIWLWHLEYGKKQSQLTRIYWITTLYHFLKNHVHGFKEFMLPRTTVHFKNYSPLECSLYLVKTGRDFNRR